jgi:hypothetical protein
LKYGNWEIAKIFLKRIIALGSCNTCEDFFLMTARLISCWTDTDQVWVGRIQSLFKNEIIRSRINDLDGSPKECWQKCLPSNISAEAVGCKFNKKGYFKESDEDADGNLKVSTILDRVHKRANLPASCHSSAILMIRRFIAIYRRRASSLLDEMMR